MQIDDYVEWARKAEQVEVTAEVSDVQLAIMGLSLLGDAGEVADMLKRRLRDGVLDRERLANELGDVLYYWARICAVTGVTPSTLLDQSRRNIEPRLARRAQAS